MPDGRSEPLVPELAELLQQLSAASDACLLLDWHGHVWEANDSARKLLGFATEELVDSALITGVAKEQRDSLLMRIRKAIAAGVPVAWHGQYIAGGKPIPLAVELQGVESQSLGTGWALGVLRRGTKKGAGRGTTLFEGSPAGAPSLEAQIRALEGAESALKEHIEQQRLKILELETQLSVRRQTEDRLVMRLRELESQLATRLEEQRRATGDLAAVGVTLGGLLKGPLPRLEWLLQNVAKLTQDGPVPRHTGEMLEAALAETEGQKRLLSAVTEFAAVGRQPLKFEEVDMTAVFHEAAQTLQEEAASLGCGIRIGDLPRCQGDRALLQILARHLLSNAVRFSCSSPNPEVEVSGWADEKQAGRRVLREQVWVVRDNGPGVPPDRMRRLFLPVSRPILQTDGLSGFGYGLATVRRIVHRLNGRVWVESPSGGGAAFSFTIGKPEKVSWT